jgi:hypothetical protein
MAFSQGLYEGLCATLLNHEPETGAALFRLIMELKTTRIVDTKTGIQYLLFSLFEANDSPAVNKLLNIQLERCHSDKDLSELVYLAQSSGKHEWLDGIIKALLCSEFDYDRARALRMMGFSNEDKHIDEIEMWISSHQRSWLMDVAITAQKCQNHNAWAKIWLTKFISEENRDNSWAAFRLFLQCVDKRVWLWCDDMIITTDLPRWKRDAYRSNQGVILESTKKNEEKLKDSFVCHDVKENELWPWMHRYL